MGERQISNFEKRFNRGFVVVYPEKPLEGTARRMQNQKILEAVKAVLTGYKGEVPAGYVVLRPSTFGKLIEVERPKS